MGATAKSEVLLERRTAVVHGRKLLQDWTETLWRVKHRDATRQDRDFDIRKTLDNTDSN